MKSTHSFLAIIFLLLAWWFSPLYYITVYPARSENATRRIDVYQEPVQESLEIDPFLITSRDNTPVTLIPVANYEINARVAINRTYPNYFNSEDFEDFLTSDMALVWGEFAENAVFKKVKFAHQFMYSTFRYYDNEISQKPGLQYLSEHFSSNHIIAKNKNIDHALRRAKKGDHVRIKGYLVNIEIPDRETIKTSLSRKDNWTPGEGNSGGSEFIYATEFQLGNDLYK